MNLYRKIYPFIVIVVFIYSCNFFIDDSDDIPDPGDSDVDFKGEDASYSETSEDAQIHESEEPTDSCYPSSYNFYGTFNALIISNDYIPLKLEEDYSYGEADIIWNNGKEEIKFSLAVASFMEDENATLLVRFYSLNGFIADLYIKNINKIDKSSLSIKDDEFTLEIFEEDFYKTPIAVSSEGEIFINELNKKLDEYLTGSIYVYVF